MTKRLLLHKIDRLLTPEEPHTLKIFISGAPDLKWILTSKLTPEEINRRIKELTVPDRLYKEVPHEIDLTVTAVDEATAEAFLRLVNHEHPGTDKNLKGSI